MATELNIIDLIENNPITKLSNTYNITLLEKIKISFSDNEQQLFITSFYCYLNYNKENDFVVDMDNVWKWLGFSTKQHAKSVLERHFKINVDYKDISLTRSRKRSDNESIHEKGGQNKHVDRNSKKEREREEYIISLGNKMIRYNPNISTFDYIKCVTKN